MTTTYLNQIRITLEPVYYDDPPEIRVGIDEHLEPATLTKTTTFDLDFDATADNYNLIVEFINKRDTDTDTERGLDKAVKIVSIEIFGITDPKFIYASIYRPEYPRQWVKQQQIKPRAELTGQTYLGWNGQWQMPFSVPIFTWVHKTQNLGWIYT
jgi:hypothetical protein